MNTERLRITYHFRSQDAGYSIQELFFGLQKALAEHLSFNNVFVPYETRSMTYLVKNGLFSRRHAGDINHITGDIHYASLFLPAKRTVLTIHDLRMLEGPSSLRKQVIRLLWFTLPLKKVAVVTTISHETKRKLLERFGKAAERIRVVHNCVNPAYVYTEKVFDEACPTILMVGTAENKNVERALESLADLSVRVVIIGRLTAPQRALLEQLAIDFDNPSDLSVDEVIARYRQCDIVLFPSTYEGFGMPIIEAQAIGRPVITSNLSSMPEVAGDGAILVDPHSVADIRRAVVSLIEDDELRSALVARGLKNVARFEASRVAQAYMAIYEELARG